MRLKNIVIKILLLILFILLSFLTISKASSSDLYLRNLNYDVTLNSDGSARVTETWDIDIEDTNTLFKTFEIDKEKYTEITNVSLIETTNGIYKIFKRINEEKYHVDKDCFYALINKKGQFEVAWGVHEDDARRTFKMSYTIIDAVKNYNDISEFYWQFVSKKSEIPAKYVTGTITLQNEVTNIDDLRIWAHGPLNGTINKISNKKIQFEVSSLSSRTMLEVRVVTPTYVFNQNNNIKEENKLESILEEEQKWADEANRKRQAKERIRQIIKCLAILAVIASNISGIFVFVILCKKIKKYKAILNEEAPNITPTSPSKYYRDIPNKDTTPAEAAYLYYFNKSTFSLYISNVISATILDFAYKQYIKIDIEKNNNKEDIVITLLPNKDKNTLSADEKIVYEMLEVINPEKRFTMKEFEKYCKNHPSSFSKKYNKIESETKKELINKKLYDKNLIKKSEDYGAYFVGFLLGFFISPVFMFICIIPFLILTIYSNKLYKRYHTLTQKGTDEKEAWNGLKNFMDDFSMMDKKEVPELVLWEHYLIYATAFGISDKVLKDLKVIYPQITDPSFMSANNYMYLYLMTNHNFSNNFIHNINHSILTGTSYSSGSGSGGGFSGGGGFGGGGGRNGRKIKYILFNIYIVNLKLLINKNLKDFSFRFLLSFFYVLSIKLSFQLSHILEQL